MQIDKAREVQMALETPPQATLELPAAWEKRNDAWKQLTIHNGLVHCLRQAVQTGAVQNAAQALAQWQAEFVTYQSDMIHSQAAIAAQVLLCAQIATLTHQTIHTFSTLLRKLGAQGALPDLATCSLAMNEPTIWPEFLRRTLYGMQWQTPTQATWAWDMIAAFLNSPRPLVRTEPVTVLLRSGEGETATLTLELLADPGQGVLYPNPTMMSFIERNSDFQQAEQEAVAWLRAQGLWVKHHQLDVRWTLARRNGRPLARLEGASLGGAFALGLAKLWIHQEEQAALASLKEVELTGIAVTARIQADGRLQTVTGEHEKLIAAAREKSFPRIHTVIVAKDQLRQSQSSFYDFRIHQLATMTELVTTLAVESQTRWQGTDCALPLRNSGFVGRRQLASAVTRFIENCEAGYLVITGSKGMGKSAFLAEFIHRARAQGDEPVYHFIDSTHSATGKLPNLATCLYSRLRRKYTFAEPPQWKSLPIADKLERLLQHISENELVDGRKEVLYIDGADQVQVTPNTVLLPGVLRKLPPGIICIITSRPSMKWLRMQQSITVWEMRDYTDDRSDIRTFLRQKAQQLLLPISDHLIEQIVSQEFVPNFWTVTNCLEQIKDPHQKESKKQWLLVEPTPWVAPPGHSDRFSGEPFVTHTYVRAGIIALSMLALLLVAFIATNRLRKPIVSLPAPVVEDCVGSQEPDAPVIVIFDFFEESPGDQVFVEETLFDELVTGFRENSKICRRSEVVKNQTAARQQLAARGAVLGVWGRKIEGEELPTERPFSLAQDIGNAHFQITEFPKLMGLRVGVTLSKIYYVSDQAKLARDTMQTVINTISADKPFIEANAKDVAEAYLISGYLFFESVTPYDLKPTDQDRLQRALRDFAKAYELDNEAQWALFFMARTYDFMNAFPQAIEQYTKIIGCASMASDCLPNNMDITGMALVNRGLAYAQLPAPDFTAAIADIQAAIRIEPDNLWRYHQLGKLQLQAGLYKDAEETYANVLCFLSPEDHSLILDDLVYSFTESATVALSSPLSEALAEIESNLKGAPTDSACK